MIGATPTMIGKGQHSVLHDTDAVREPAALTCVKRGRPKSLEQRWAVKRRTDPDRGTSFLLVVHNLDPARRCDRIIEVVDGRIQP